jgi:hypothetical protein
MIVNLSLLVLVWGLFGKERIGSDWDWIVVIEVDGLDWDVNSRCQDRWADE